MLSATWFVFVALSLSGLSWVSWVVGRDTGEARCQSTIATLGYDKGFADALDKAFEAVEEMPMSAFDWGMVQRDDILTAIDSLKRPPR